MYKKLRSEIILAGLNQKSVAQSANIPEASFCLKINGKRDWKFDEAVRVKQAIGTDVPMEVLFER